MGIGVATLRYVFAETDTLAILIVSTLGKEPTYKSYNCPEKDGRISGVVIDTLSPFHSWHDCAAVCQLDRNCMVWSWHSVALTCDTKSTMWGLHYEKNKFSGERSCL